ncbi:response regulator [Deinococcus sonorensis]|uniref:Transcriptional regulatory protein n=2 Tax=Deinococcus sonorensis TaxID=309891 RepID=A0AAU7UBU3_9DEIO
MNPGAGPIRVLLVEDDLWVARVNRELVDAWPGAEVVGTASTLAEGERLLATLKPELLLLDVYLPDGSGLSLLQAVRASGQALEVILLTAADDVVTVQQALALGASDYVIKPFERERLYAALQRVQLRRRPLPAHLTQRHLDRFLGLDTVQNLPKGIDAETLQRVQGLLAAQGRSLSAEEVGAQVGISRVTAWRYLEYLVQAGQAVLDFTYGQPGRPTKLYRSARQADGPEPT